MSWTKDASGWNVFLTLLFLLFMIPANLIFEGWIIQKYWLWFIQPAFNIAIPSIGICMGLALIHTFLSRKPIIREDSEEEKERQYHPAAVALGGTFVILVFWLMGWAIFCLSK